jgi:hypothetical protein
MGDVLQTTEFVPRNVKYNTSRLYNFAFPIIILVPLLFDLIVLFLVPVEKAVDTTRNMLSVNKLTTIKSSIGNLDMFKFANPTRPGNIASTK